MPVVLAAILAFILGAVATYVAVVAGGFWYMQANHIFDRDGGMSMAIMFALGPLAGLVGGTLAAIVTAVRGGRRARARARGELPPKQPWPLPVRMIGAVVVGLLAYFAAWGIMWLVGPLSFKTYAAAFAVSVLPMALGVIAAGLIAWRALRRRPQSNAG